MFLLSHEWISLLHLPEARAKTKTVEKVKRFKGALKGSKEAFVNCWSTSVSLETIHKMSEIFVLADIIGRIASLSIMADL